MFKASEVEIFTAACVGIALRSIVSLHSYSGAAKPPMYGDYEAQRHWQEITINLEVKDWYTNSSDNDLLYWGLDYPPLSAYHSYLMSAIGKFTNDSYVELVDSRGIESGAHKSFMRATVLISDIIVYIPAALALAVALESTTRMKLVFPLFMIIMIYPGQILIDNGHFQYNNMSLGFAALAISSILIDHSYLAAFFYTLALNYKQMELYHAIPFFIFLLRICFSEKKLADGIRKLLTIASITLLTFYIIWCPWMHCFQSFNTVMKRLFPIGRGVFEDIVANFWCLVNTIYKLKKNLSNQQMAFLSLSTTVIAVLPTTVSLFVNAKKERFLYSLFNTAMSFFLFSYQVHEKSILLVALPATCLFAFNPMEVVWFLEITVYSMFPLFLKDGLVLSFFSMLFIFHCIIEIMCINNFSVHSEWKINISLIRSISTTINIVLVLAAIAAPSPLRYPFIWPLMISLFSCIHFIAFLVFSIFVKNQN